MIFISKTSQSKVSLKSTGPCAPESVTVNGVVNWGILTERDSDRHFHLEGSDRVGAKNEMKKKDASSDLKYLGGNELQLPQLRHTLLNQRFNIMTQLSLIPLLKSRPCFQTQPSLTMLDLAITFEPLDRFLRFKKANRSVLNFLFN